MEITDQGTPKMVSSYTSTWASNEGAITQICAIHK